MLRRRRCRHYLRRLLCCRPHRLHRHMRSLHRPPCRFQLSRRRPEVIKKALRQGAIDALPEGFDVDTHFSPAYNPWDQRLCLVPNGDLFAAISAGTVDVVTEHIERFTDHGIVLKSGVEIPADIIVTATGLSVQMLGGMTIELDGIPLDISTTVAYKGIMLCGVPNLAMTYGYTNASWTLKADLTAEYVIGDTTILG